MKSTKSMLQQIHKLKEYLQKEHDLLDKTHEMLTKIIWQNTQNDVIGIVDVKKQIEDFKLFNDMEIAKLLQ